MSVSVGTRLGFYEILSRIGEGGMGEVWKARDTRLGRIVAVKVLLPGKTKDPDRNRRFVQEAKTASALSHPNIVMVHDIGTEGDVTYLVMEYIAGRPLNALIPRGGCSLEEILNLATQIAGAISSAHAAGTIHRDLKPANVMATPDRLVKVLDFGLAKLVEPAHPSGDDKTVPQTVEGAVLGTVAYMSPEQAEGKPLDGRSDIFSFGSLLYEMCTGQRAFQGDSQAAVMAAVLRDEPTPIEDLRPDLPAELTRIVTRCLRKEPSRRAQSMLDLKLALDELKDETRVSGRVTAISLPPARAAARRRGLVGVALLIVAVVSAGLLLWREAFGPDRAPATLQPVPLTSYPGDERWASFSPDGSQITFGWTGEKDDNMDIYVKVVGKGTPLRLTTNPGNDFRPQWSPDGLHIAFMRYVGRGEFGVFLMSPLGGPERKVAQFYTIFDLGGPLAATCWTPDGQYLLVTGSQTPNEPNQLLRLAIATGEVKTLASAHGGTEEGYSLPALSPDGRTVAVLRRRGSSSSFVELVSLSATYEFESSRMLESAGNTVGSVDWTADGRDLIFSLTSNNPLPLFRISADGGEPQSLSWSGANASGPELAASGGRLAFVRTIRDANIWQVSLDQLQHGQPALRQLASSSFRDVFPQYSPDGKRLVFHSNREGSGQIWISDIDGSRAAPLTSMNKDAVTGTPRWSPDGRWISFDSSATGRYQVYVISADGGAPRALTSGDSDNFTAAWSADGNWIYFASSRSGTQQIWKVPTGGGTPEQVTQNGGQAPTVSPDGNWLYYTKNDGSGGIWKIPVEGGAETRIVDASFRYNYAVASEGIYFVPRIAADGTSSIRFRNFETGQETEILKIEKPVDLGLAVSPGGGELLFSQIDYSGQDLMLVEHFK